MKGGRNKPLIGRNIYLIIYQQKTWISIVKNVMSLKQIYLFPYLFNFSNVSNLSDNVIRLSNKFEK